jgi:hypothetical protein
LIELARLKHKFRMILENEGAIMKVLNKYTCLIPILIAGIFLMNNESLAENHELKVGGFSIEHQLTLPGTPGVIYDAITGDISGWWDHSVSEKPLKFYIDPKPGGGFYEIFNESGDGVKHATVILANRGKLLRFEGPLGLSGNAIQMVHTYEFEPVGSDSTLLKLTVNAAGQMEEGWPEIVDKVWRHFLFEQFKPYIESGKHLEK